jgi:hypothetical protein
LATKVNPLGKLFSTIWAEHSEGLPYWVDLQSRIRVWGRESSSFGPAGSGIRWKRKAAVGRGDSGEHSSLPRRRKSSHAKACGVSSCFCASVGKGVRVAGERKVSCVE